MIRKLLNKVKRSKGFLTKSGSLVNYEEVHAFGLGIIDGAGFKGQGYRLEFWLETHDDVNQGTVHYYEKGYFWTQLFKYVATAGLILYFGGNAALRTFLIGV